MNYTTQITGSPYQIHPGEAFSAYVSRMDEANGGSFLSDFAEQHPDIVDTLGAAESLPLAEVLWPEMTPDQQDAFTDSPDFEAMTQGLDDDGPMEPEALLAAAFEDCMTRADLLGLAESRAPGVLVRVATRIRSAP